MASSPKVQFASQIVKSKSKYQPLRPQFARHGTSEVASTARDKLGDQAGRAEHDLRLLVGHANTLDYLNERLYARQQEKNNASERDTAKAGEQRERNRDVPQNVGFERIAIESDHGDSNEEATLNDDMKNMLNAIPEEVEEKSYFDMPEDKDKGSAGWSVMELLEYDSDSYSDSDSSDDDADADSGSEKDGRYDRRES